MGAGLRLSLSLFFTRLSVLGNSQAGVLVVTTDWIAREHWGKGYASHALRMMMDYVFAPNTASARVLEKCGYELEARLRQSVFKNGVFFDQLIYTRLR